MWLSGLGISPCLSHSQSHALPFSPLPLASPILILVSYSRVTLSQFRDNTRSSASFSTLISISLFISTTSASDVPLGSASWRHSPVLGGRKTRKLLLSLTMLSLASSCFMQVQPGSPARRIPRWKGWSGCKKPVCALQLAPCKWPQSPICTESRQCSQCPSPSH